MLLSWYYFPSFSTYKIKHFSIKNKEECYFYKQSKDDTQVAVQQVHHLYYHATYDDNNSNIKQIFYKIHKYRLAKVITNNNSRIIPWICRHSCNNGSHYYPIYSHIFY